MMLSPKIVVNDALLKNPSPLTKKRVKNNMESKPNMSKFYWECFINSFILLYGFLILLF